MRARLPRIGLAAVLAFFALTCQSAPDAPTDVARSLEEQGVTASPEAAEIFQMIQDLLPHKPATYSTTQFTAIVLIRERSPRKAKAWGQQLMGYLLRQYSRNRWQDPAAGGETGELVAAIAAYVGLAPEAEAAAACVPGVDCEVGTTQGTEFVGSEIPGDMVTQPFVLYVVRLPDDAFAPPLFPLFYEIHTIPEGITFPPSSPSGSLSLSQSDDQPFAALCALDGDDPLGPPEGAVPGENLFLAHQVNGVWEQTPYVDPPAGLLDCASAGSGAGASRWIQPFEYAASLLAPNALYAKGRGLGGAISSFSPFGALYTGSLGPAATTTTISIAEGRTTFFAGETITFRAVVSPAPDGGNVLFYATVPPRVGAGVEGVVDGVAERERVCGSSRIPFGTHEAEAEYLGTSTFEGSVSAGIQYACLEAPGD